MREIDVNLKELLADGAKGNDRGFMAFASKGRAFQPGQLSEDERALVGLIFKKRYAQFPLGKCFRNAQRMVRMDGTKSLAYCEGFAIATGIGVPLHHAWCVTQRGRVIDPTWAFVFVNGKGMQDSGPVLGEFNDDAAYFGVRIPVEVLDARDAKRFGGSVFMDFAMQQKGQR